MADKSWKAYERRLAKALGGQRIPVTGIGRADRDVEAGMFYYQAKLRKAIPKCIRAWSDGICATAKRDNKIGILIMKEPGLHDANALVVLRYQDWLDLHGGPHV